MEYRPLNLTIISADNLKDVNLMSTMDVYVDVSISGDPRTRQRTPVAKDGGKSPRWNHRLNFSVYEPAISDSVCLVFKIFSDRVLGDKEIGEVTVPIKQLLDQSAAAGVSERVVEYQVRTTSGKSKGSLKFSYKFGDKVAAPVAPTPPIAAAAKNPGEPVMAYPPPQVAGYGHHYPPQQSGYGYPPQQPGYRYSPQQPGYGYARPPPGYGGYAAPPPGYGGGYGYPPVKPPKKHGGGLGVGLAGGLLGGLLIGDMISDVGDVAAYDAGYDAGFDDGFDF